MIYYTINHYVTSDGTDPMETTKHGDSDLCVWASDDYATAPPDHRHDQPATGWHWRTNEEGWQSHPDVLAEYVDAPDEIQRVDVWATTLTDEQ